MHEMSRRQVIAGAAAVACAASVPAITALAAPIRAEMFCTEDEPWGALVRGHVRPDQFKTAVLDLLDTDSDARESGEDWLFETVLDFDEMDAKRVILGEPEHSYMRLSQEDHPELGETFVRCSASYPGAIPITVLKY